MKRMLYLILGCGSFVANYCLAITLTTAPLVRPRTAPFPPEFEPNVPALVCRAVNVSSGPKDIKIELVDGLGRVLVERAVSLEPSHMQVDAIGPVSGEIPHFLADLIYCRVTFNGRVDDIRAALQHQPDLVTVSVSVDALPSSLDRAGLIELPDLPAEIAFFKLPHVRVKVPRSSAELAKKFYIKLLGLQPVNELTSERGFWLQTADFRFFVEYSDKEDGDLFPMRRVTLEVQDLGALWERLQKCEITIVDSSPISGMGGFEIRDPFGNRLEFVEMNDISN